MTVTATAALLRLARQWESMAGPANSVYETCARDLRAVVAALAEQPDDGAAS